MPAIMDVKDDLSSQIELLATACRRTLETSENDPVAREALAAALSRYDLSSSELRRIARPHITGLANMVRAHTDNLRHALGMASDDETGRRLVRGALQLVLSSLTELREALEALPANRDAGIG